MKRTIFLAFLCLLASSVLAQQKIIRPVHLSKDKIMVSKNFVQLVEMEKIKSQMENSENVLPKNEKTPRPDLAGLRLMHLTGNEVYLVNPEDISNGFPMN